MQNGHLSKFGTVFVPLLPFGSHVPLFLSLSLHRRRLIPQSQFLHSRRVCIQLLKVSFPPRPRFVHFSSCARQSSKKAIRVPPKVATFARFPNLKPQESVNPVISKAPEFKEKEFSVFESSWEFFPDCFRAAEQCERTMGRRWHAVAAVGMAFAAAAIAVAADGGFPLSLAGAEVAPLPQEEMSMLQKLAYLMFKKDGTSYQHVWPVINFMLCISQFHAFV
jgi:hypothetical protein